MPTLLITGANRGLGLAFTERYLADGWLVRACCRQASERLSALSGRYPDLLHTHILDVLDHGRIDALAAQLQDTPIDLLLNNAGTAGEGGLGTGSLGHFDYEGWRRILEVNLLGPIKMAEAFVEHVARSEQKKIVTISSMLASIGSNTNGGYAPYRVSKAAVNAAMRSLAMELKDRGIIVIPISPGWVRTDMGGSGAPLSPEESVAGMRKVIANLTRADTGRFFTLEGDELPW